MHVGDLLAERKTDAAARHASECRNLAFGEWLEYAPAVLLRHAYSIILHHDTEFSIAFPVKDSHFNLTSVRSIFECIGKQIVDKSLKSHGVSPYHEGIHRLDRTKLHMTLDRHIPEIVIHILNKLYHIKAAHVQLHLSVSDGSCIKELIHKGKHPLGILLDKIDAVFILIAGRSLPVYVLDSSQDKSQRSTKLMGDICKEPGLDIVKALLKSHITAELHRCKEDPDYQCGHGQNQEHIHDTCKSGIPYRRFHPDLYAYHIFRKDIFRI